jgi:ribosomal protein L40E
MYTPNRTHEVEMEAERRAEAHVAKFEFTEEDAQKWGDDGACVRCGHEAPTFEGTCRRCMFDATYNGFCMELGGM